jgi:hypothetical protein
MELDDLKSTWQQLDRKLDRQYALDLGQLRERKLVKVRLTFVMLIVGRIVQLLAGVALNVLMVRFVATHLHQPHLVVEGTLLTLFGLLMMASAVREFQLIGGIDLSAPVVTIQKRLLLLKRWHLTEALIFGLAASVIWVPLTLVAFEVLFDADVVLNAPEVVLSFVASALVCVAIVTGIWRSTSRVKNPATRDWLERHFGGQSLAIANQAVADLARFELDV